MSLFTSRGLGSDTIPILRGTGRSGETKLYVRLDPQFIPDSFKQSGGTMFRMISRSCPSPDPPTLMCRTFPPVRTYLEGGDCFTVSP